MVQYHDTFDGTFGFGHMEKLFHNDGIFGFSMGIVTLRRGNK
jgi:hypothetical protein